MKTSHYLFLVATVIAVVNERCAVQGQLSASGSHVCRSTHSYNTYYSARAQRIGYSNYQACCAKFLWWCTKKCTRYRTKTVIYYVNKLRVQYKNSYHCCPGWARKGSGCPIPICRPACRNGNCIAPNRCKCKSGFTGRYCDIDINECSKSPCQQICKNFAGTYACSCRRGYRKVSSSPTDRRCQNINECASSKRLCSCAVQKDNCRATCVDTVGSYKCQCGAGYQLIRSRICKDIDECRTGGHGCQHKCINELGGYKCDCNLGYSLGADKRSCNDVDECRYSNGGCEHKCTNIVGSYKCSCRRGYVLSYDATRCADINECLQKPCDPITSVCQNLPGRYKCSCRPGYTLGKANKCQDVDECKGRNQCEQVCHNTVGSYYCSCRAGYSLKADKETCEDFDECKNSRNDCDQMCINMVGTYRCQCNLGYKLQADKKTCKAIRCGALEKPRNGAITCTGYTYNHSCAYTCNDGYQLIGNKYRTCQVSSRWTMIWTGDIPICSPISCPEIRPPLNGILRLPCNKEYNSICTVKCKRGFILDGNEDIACGIKNGSVIWVNNNATCRESKACYPNPCKNNGTCRRLPSSAYECDCSGTGFTGSECDIGIVSIPPYPTLIYGRSTDWIEVTGRPDNELLITPQSINGKAIFTPRRMAIRFPLTTAKFKVTPRSFGLLKIQYGLSGASARQFRPIAGTLVYVASDEPSEKINQVPDDDLSSEQCHKLELDRCPNKQRIHLLSSCPWTSSGTLGYQSVSVGKLRLPLSIGGIGLASGDKSRWMYTRKGVLSVSREVRKALKGEPRFCAPGEMCNNKGYTLAEHRFVVQQNLFVRSHLKALSSLIPKWMNIDMLYGYRGFHISNFQGMVLKGERVRQLKTCQSVPRKLSRSSVFVSQLMFLPITFQIHGLKKTIESSSPTCVLTDICQMATYISLPADKAIDLTSQLKMIGVTSLQLRVFGFGFRRGAKTECIKVDGASEQCFDGSIWLKASINVKGKMLDVMSKGELSLALENLDDAASDRFTKPLKFFYRSELKATISVMAGNKPITFDILDKDGAAYGAFGLPSSSRSTDDVNWFSLTTKASIYTTHTTSIVSFHPEHTKGKFKANIRYGLFGGRIGGIQNKATTLTLLRRLVSSLSRIISSTTNTPNRVHSVLKTEYDSLANFSKSSKVLIENTIKKLSLPTPQYPDVYQSVLSVISLVKRGNDIVELLLTRASSLRKRRSTRRVVLSKLNVLKRSLLKVMQLQVVPFTTPVTETFKGVKLDYSGKLCFWAICFDNLNVSIDDGGKTSSNDLFITAKFRQNETFSGNFKVVQGTTLKARVSKSTEVFVVKFEVNTKVFGIDVSTIFEINQRRARCVLPAFKLSPEMEFDVELRADLLKKSSWRNIFFRITGSATKNSNISRRIEKRIEDFLKATSKITRERRENASLIANKTNMAIRQMDSKVKAKRESFRKAKTKYQKLKGLHAEAVTNLTSSIVRFRSYRASSFFNTIEEELNRRYPLERCNTSCIQVPVYCICQDAVNVDVNTISCQLVDKESKAVIERPKRTKCIVPKYEFIPVQNKKCSRSPLAAIAGPVGAAVGVFLGGPAGASVGFEIGSTIGSLINLLFAPTCDESYEVHKKITHEQVDCTLSVTQTVTKRWKESVCANRTINVVSGYENPSECPCPGTGRCVLAEDQVCAENNIRNAKIRRVRFRQRMESAGKYNDSYDRLQDAQATEKLMSAKAVIAEKRYLAEKRDYEELEAKLKQARLELKFTNTSISNFEEKFALERCLSRAAEVSRQVSVKNVTFDISPQSKDEIFVKLIVERTNVRNLEEKAFLLNLGEVQASLKNGAKKVAKEIFCARKLRARRSLFGSPEQHNKELFVQHSIKIPQHLTNADKWCLVSNTVFAFLRQAVNYLDKHLQSFQEKQDEIGRAMNDIKPRLRKPQSTGLDSQNNLLNPLMAQLGEDMKRYTVNKLYENWINDMEIVTGAANFTKCLYFMDCLKESFRQLKELPNIARIERSDYISSIEETNIGFMTISKIDSFDELSVAVAKIKKLTKKIIGSSVFCSKVPQVNLNKPPKVEAILGSDLDIRCVAQSDVEPVKYTWVHNNATMMVEDNEILHLNVGEDSGGAYKCIASSVIGQNTSEETFIVVGDKPRLVEEPADFRYFSSMPTEIHPYFVCNATSNPPASISWYHQRFDSETAVLLNHTKPAFTIERPTALDAGFYRCSVRNTFGMTKSRKARLDVLDSRPSSQRFILLFDVPLERVNAIDKDLINREVVAEGKLSAHHLVNVSYEFKNTKDMNVKISVTDRLHEDDKQQIVSEADMLRRVTGSRKGLENSLRKIVDGLRKGRWSSLPVVQEKSMRIGFSGDLCESGYFMHENGFMCLQCRAGSFGRNGICYPCSIGTYQSNPGQTSCLACDSKDITREIGANTKDQCVKPELQSYDILFVLDSSNRIGRQNWATVKSFVRSFTDEFISDNIDLRIGVMTYSNLAKERIPLNRYNKSDILESINNLPYFGGLTRTYIGLLRAQQVLQKNFIKGRTRLLILMTDGRSTYIGRMRGSVLSRRAALIVQKAGVQMISIGVGEKIDPIGLKAMASFPKLENIIQNKSFNQLISASRIIAAQSLRGQCYSVFRDIAVAVEASSVVDNKTWEYVRKYLRQFLLQLSSTSDKVSVSTFDRVVKVLGPFQEIQPGSDIDAAVSKITRNTAEKSADYIEITEQIYNNHFTEVAGSLSPNKILIMITKESFSLQSLNTMKRTYPEENITLLTVVMNLETDDDGEDSSEFEDVSQFTMAQLSGLLTRIKAETSSRNGCTSAAK